MCARTNKPNHPSPDEFQHLPSPHWPWSHIVLDFTTGLHASESKNIMVPIVYCFTNNWSATLGALSLTWQHSWAKYLIWAELSHNLHTSPATKLCPFEVCHRFQPPSSITKNPRSTHLRPNSWCRGLWSLPHIHLKSHPTLHRTTLSPAPSGMIVSCR